MKKKARKPAARRPRTGAIRDLEPKRGPKGGTRAGGEVVPGDFWSPNVEGPLTWKIGR